MLSCLTEPCRGTAGKLCNRRLLFVKVPLLFFFSSSAHDVLSWFVSLSCAFFFLLLVFRLSFSQPSTLLPSFATACEEARDGTARGRECNEVQRDEQKRMKCKAPNQQVAVRLQKTGRKREKKDDHAQAEETARRKEIDGQQSTEANKRKKRLKEKKENSTRINYNRKNEI